MIFPPNPNMSGNPRALHAFKTAMRARRFAKPFVAQIASEVCESTPCEVAR